MRAILHHMLQGLRVDENPLLADSHQETKLDILYEDDYLLVINKPEGMLSVPGKGDVDSVYQRLSILYPEATGPIIVHSLGYGDIRLATRRQDQRSASEPASPIQEPNHPEKVYRLIRGRSSPR